MLNESFIDSGDNANLDQRHGPVDSSDSFDLSARIFMSGIFSWGLLLQSLEGYRLLFGLIKGML